MYKGLMLAKAIMACIQQTDNPPKVGEGEFIHAAPANSTPTRTIRSEW
jgi:hypothetical protein